MSFGRKPMHAERTEAQEVEIDRLLPGQNPVLPLFLRGEDGRRVLARVPDLERHKLYLGRLVNVEDDNGARRKGSIESFDDRIAVVRYLDWDDLIDGG